VETAINGIETLPYFDSLKAHDGKLILWLFDAGSDTGLLIHSDTGDDSNRLWVSTIVEDFDVYEWWVLEDNGELITKFDWPRDEPIEVIKNGKMYTRQTDEETGLERIVRYQILLK
jgi:hypothetical protein